MKKKAALLIVLLFTNLLLRWNSFGTPLERDEGEYAYSAWILREGGLPYRDTFLQKPPLIVYTYFLGQLVSPNGLWFPRLLAMVFSVVTSVLLYEISERRIFKGSGLVAALIYAVAVASPINASLAANTEVFMLLPLVAFLFLFMICDMNKLLNWVTAGLLASLSLMYKPICLYVLAFILVYYFFGMKKRAATVKKLLVNITLFTLGGLMTALVFLLPFWLRGVGKYLWEEVVVFNGYYLKQWGYSLNPLWQNFKILFRGFWFLYLLLVIFLLIKSKNRLFFFGCLFFSLLAVFQTNIRHYLMLLMPFFALMAAQAISSLGGVRFGRLSWRLKAGVLTVITLVTLLWPVREQFIKSPRELILWVYGVENPFYEAPLVAGKLGEITKPGDRVFVAGSEPEILYYAKRGNVVRFNITYPLIIDTPRRLDYQKEAIYGLQKNKPAAIVYSTRKHSGLWDEESPKEFIGHLDALVKSEYRLVGGYVWDLRGGYWLDKLSEDDQKNSSLLLYKKI